MQPHARRSRLIAAGLGVGTLVALVAGMVNTEQVSSTPAAGPPPGPAITGLSTTAGPTTPADPFATGRPATPPSSPAAGRRSRTVTRAS